MRLTPVFAFLGLALLFWAAAAVLSSRLGGPGPSAPVSATRLPPELESLRRAAEQSPRDPHALFSYGRALSGFGLQQGDGTLIMQGLRQYQQVLALDAEHAEALLGLADLSFETGVIDKAVPYYERYLAKRPGDDRARTNLALAHLQLDQTARSIEILQEILGRQPELFPPRLALALAFKVAGNLDAAEAEAARALDYAPDDQARQVLTQFTAGLRQPRSGMPEGHPPLNGVPAGDSTAARPAAVAAPPVAPASGVFEEYFRKDPVIGPKLAGVRAEDPAQPLIMVRDFPVQAMPEFAKQKFISRVAEAFRRLPGKVTLRLVDAGSGAELLAIESGSGAPGAQ